MLIADFAGRAFQVHEDPAFLFRPAEGLSEPGFELRLTGWGGVQALQKGHAGQQQKTGNFQSVDSSARCTREMACTSFLYGTSVKEGNRIHSPSLQLE